MSVSPIQRAIQQKRLYSRLAWSRCIATIQQLYAIQQYSLYTIQHYTPSLSDDCARSAPPPRAAARAQNYLTDMPARPKLLRCAEVAALDLYRL